MLETFPGDRLFRETVHDGEGGIEMILSREKQCFKVTTRGGFQLQTIEQKTAVRNRDTLRCCVLGSSSFSRTAIEWRAGINGINGLSFLHPESKRNLLGARPWILLLQR